jgi:hypothetical protein
MYAINTQNRLISIQKIILRPNMYPWITISVQWIILIKIFRITS